VVWAVVRKQGSSSELLLLLELRLETL
jgi:hypothetical protein